MLRRVGRSSGSGCAGRPVVVFNTRKEPMKVRIRTGENVFAKRRERVRRVAACLAAGAREEQVLQKLEPWEMEFLRVILPETRMASGRSDGPGRDSASSPTASKLKATPAPKRKRKPVAASEPKTRTVSLSQADRDAAHVLQLVRAACGRPCRG